MISPSGLSNYREDYLSQQLRNSIAGLKLSIVSFDWNRGFEFYAREILQLEHELKIPASDKLELIALLWPVLIAKENDLSVRTYIKVVQVLSCMLREHKELLDSLVLDWKQLYELIEKYGFRMYKNPNFVGSKLVSQLRNSLIILIKRARRFF
jgi:hypothetical protein